MNPVLFAKLAMAFTLVLSIFGSIGAMWLAHRIKVSPPPKRWDTDPAVPMPHRDTTREARERAQGFRVAAAGKTFCYECGTPVGVHLDKCCACGHKLIWNA